MPWDDQKHVIHQSDPCRKKLARSGLGIDQSVTPETKKLYPCRKKTGSFLTKFGAELRPDPGFFSEVLLYSEVRCAAHTHDGDDGDDQRCCVSDAPARTRPDSGHVSVA